MNLSTDAYIFSKALIMSESSDRGCEKGRPSGSAIVRNVKAPVSSESLLLVVAFVDVETWRETIDVKMNLVWGEEEDESFLAS